MAMYHWQSLQSSFDDSAVHHPYRAAVFFHPLIMSWPQYDRLSMCSSSSSQVITPGVESGATKFGQPEHFGYAPTSLHMSSQTPASLFCTWARCWASSAAHALLSCAWDATAFWSSEACLRQPLSRSRPQSTRLSMCSSSSSQVITPGVESGGTKLGQPEHFG